MSVKLDPQFIVDLQGKDFVLYQGLLDMAHQMGLYSLTTEILQFPTKENENTCIVQAIASGTRDNESYRFSDIGDANPANTGKKVAAHLIRLASTRSKARTLRDYTNVGIAALEEMDLEPDIVVTQKVIKPVLPPNEAFEAAVTALRTLGATVLAPDISLMDKAEVIALVDRYREKYKELNKKIRMGEKPSENELSI